jgi:DNA repair exonuclease SbcCD nuclease subunit
MHTSLGGSSGHDLYAPCSVADLRQTGFRYWALGHIHKRSAVEDSSSAIVMPGIPQGRDINEDGPKSVSLVTIGDDRSVVVEERQTAIAQFERLVVDISRATDWKDVVLEAKGKLESLSSAVSADQLVARVEITGATELAWRIRRDADLLRTELETRGATIGNVWIEKVVTSSVAPKQQDARPSALDELAAIIDSEIHSSTEYRDEVRSIADELRAQLPAELREIFGKDEASFENLLAQFAKDGASQVLARLRGGEGE